MKIKRFTLYSIRRMLMILIPCLYCSTMAAAGNIPVSLPSDFPYVRVLRSVDPAEGYLYISNMWAGQPYLMIVDNAGQPVFYRRVNGNVYDFKRHPNGLLSYYIQSNVNKYYIMDSTYTVIDSIVQVKTYYPNEHELRILPNGNMLMIVSESKNIDMSKIVAGGNPSARVLGNHVVELNSRKEPVFEWLCWDHYDIRESIDADLTAASFDYVHMNAIAVDLDSNLILSCRNMSEITKINRKTGKIMWRLGGRRNQFRFINDPNTFVFEGDTLAFSYQHHVRVLPNGHYTLFDNGNLRSPPFSRAIEFVVDTTAMTSELIWEFRHDPDIYAAWMGSFFQLDNGNRLIGWSNSNDPKVTEVTPDGDVVYEMNFVNPAVTYRPNRINWLGRTRAPYLMVESQYDKVRLLFNHFGARDIQSFRIYAGQSPSPETVIAVTDTSSYELSGLENGKRYYFRVTSIDSKGVESEYSNEVSHLVHFTQPGENLVINGDFSLNDDNWSLTDYNGASSLSVVTKDGEYRIVINDGGSETWNVQLIQGNIPLVQGREYLFEFDGYAVENRIIDARIEKNGSPWNNYSKTAALYLTTQKKHFSYSFTMEEPSDFNARVSFNCGTSDVDVILDNIAVYELVENGVAGLGESVPGVFILNGNYPNPFNPETTINFKMLKREIVSVCIYNIRGELIETLIDSRMLTPGCYSAVWNAVNRSAGVYLFRVQTEYEMKTGKMILLK